ncbi:MAG: hypothetical protein IKK65_03200 [Clostridia bacterium]|nr:hypothetical protein [Clostridia bacterium]
MKNIKKTLTMCVCCVLIATLAIGGTLAYLTANLTEQPVSNIFTRGKISVNLQEDTAIIGEGGEHIKLQSGAKYDGVMPGDYLKKEVTVSNDGKTPAYVAVTVTINNADKINNAIDEFYEDKGYSAEEIQKIYNYVFDGFGINYNPRPGAFGLNDARGVIDGTYGLPEHTLKVDFAKTIKGSTVIGATNWFISGKEKPGQYWVDGPSAYDGYYTSNMNDYQLRYTYYILLEAGEKTTLFNGINIPNTFNDSQMDMFDGLQIDIDAAAIQADNFYGNAKAAFTALKADQSNNANYNVVSNNDDLKTALTKEDNVIVVDLEDDVTYDVRPWNNEAMGGVNTELIIINGNGHTLTFNQKDSDWNNIVTNGAALVLNNVKVTNSGHNDGPWNRHNINFACEVNLNNVSSDKAIAIAKDSILNNVTITDDTGVYGLWIRANNIDVEIDNLTVTAERGIKIADEYIDSPASVNLSVKNSKFNTTKKASILVTSTVGANITLENVNIYNCNADPINAVWVDEDRANYADKVTVSGGTAVVEGAPSDFVRADSNEALDQAIKNGSTTIVLDSGSYIIPDSAQGKTLKIIGTKDTKIATQDDGSYEGCDYSLDGSTVTFENITITTDSHTYTGYARLNATYINCTINGTYTLYGNSIFNNCTFNVSGDVYNIWTWGAPTATFNKCTFNTSGKALLAYGNTNTTVTVNDCTFNDDDAYTDVNNKAAIEVGSDWSSDTKTIIVNGTTVNGFDVTNKGISTGTTLWGNKNSLPTNRLNVVIDGVDVY